MSDVQQFNDDGLTFRINAAALHQRMQAQGEDWYRQVLAGCPHLFADVPVFISSRQLQQMKDVIAAIGRAVNNDKCQVASGKPGTEKIDKTLGVFYGYDFHLNAEGVHLIEINTNAGGALLNALLVQSQGDERWPGEGVAVSENAFMAMFRREWALQRGDAPLSCIAIVDQLPEQQYLYPEFVLAKSLFERNGLRALIVDPGELELRDDGVYVGGQQVDLVYNRLTDFSLASHPALRQAWLDGRVVLTPNPEHYARYADKRNLAQLTDAVQLQGASEADIATLQIGIPKTIVVHPELETMLWENRKGLFFKPNSGFGSRGAYRGEKLTKRVFGEIMQSDYVAQQMAAPGERRLDEDSLLKYDVRCYVYDGEVQLIAARLYQGQTTNFRTPGGGFAPVRVITMQSALTAKA